jgi:hypothetical protein
VIIIALLFLIVALGFVGWLLTMDTSNVFSE